MADEEEAAVAVEPEIEAAPVEKEPEPVDSEPNPREYDDAVAPVKTEAETATEDTEKPPEPKAAPAKTDAFANVLDRGLDLGWSEVEIRAFPSPDAAENAMRLAERSLIRPSKTPPQEIPAQVQQAPVAQPKVEVPSLPDVADLDEKEFDPAIVNGWKAMKGHLAAQQAKLEQYAGQAERLDGMERHIRALESERRLNELDNMFGALGPEYEPHLGKGSRNEIDPKSKQFQTRVEIAKTMDALLERYSENGRTPNAKQAFERAKQAVLADVTAQIERNKLQAKLKAQTQKATLRPTRRNGSVATGKLDNLSRVYADRGWNSEDDEPEL